ncbi:GNAT family N-acetyltransferase [Kitasatospora sp. NBC_01250]|uniref:GNAT family N-acetyltransferase n=1 Tax=Kitasatospora sp. NBC_01250 TaxID=2903571 RepID=UPI002E30ACD3|nr:GNAT family protein [Kitasatospora sp. NBC_01250]
MTGTTQQHARWINPFSVHGDHVTLVPLEERHEDRLVEAVQDGQVWDTWFAAVPSPVGMRREIEWRLGLAEQGRMVPFTVLDAAGRVAGMTAYMNVDPDNRRLEIGHTWYRGSVQRTALNTEAKLLLLQHAFEEADCIAVGFRTAFFNMPSRRAIERLGAKLEGVWRNHVILPDGTLRDTCYYSVIAGEWPAVKRHLTWKLDHAGAGAAPGGSAGSAGSAGAGAADRSA